MRKACLIVVFSILVFVVGIVPGASAIGFLSDLDLSVSVDNPFYYLRGETVQILVSTNKSNQRYTLTIRDQWDRIVYKKDRVANATGYDVVSLPTDDGTASGFYTITANVVKAKYEDTFPGVLTLIRGRDASGQWQLDMGEYHAVPGNTWTTYNKTYTQNPFTGQTWQLDDINDLQIGIKGRSDWRARPGMPPLYYPVRCTQVYAVVKYRPPKPP